MGEISKKDHHAKGWVWVKWKRTETTNGHRVGADGAHDLVYAVTTAAEIVVRLVAVCSILIPPEYMRPPFVDLSPPPIAASPAAPPLFMSQLLCLRFPVPAAT